MLRRNLKIGISLATAPSRSQESGYAFLMVLFMVVLIIAGSMVLIEKLATQGVREREAETVWRGNQYARAVRLYYHKTGRYPQTIDDLSKGLPDLHFLRQAYKNPMNKSDGTWRFIYVNAAGQIIGSTRYANLQQMMMIDSGAVAALAQAGQQPGQPGVPAGSLSDTSSNSGSQAGQAPPSSTSPSGNSSGSTLNPPSSPSGDNSQNPQNPTTPQNPPTTSPFGQGSTSAFSQSNTFGQPAGQSGQSGQAPQGTQTLASTQALLQLKPTGPVDGPVLGAFLTGVGGKGDQASLRVYHGGKKYLDWEFIWNPLEDAAAALQQGLGAQAPQPAGLPAGILGNVPLGPTTSQPGPSRPQQQQSQPPMQ